MFRRVSVLLILGVVLAACGSATSTPATTAPAPTAEPAATAETAPAATAETAPTASTALQEITVGMSYIPNVQFAFLYVADQKGYFADEGIKLNFDYNFETDVVQRVAQDTLQFGMASGDSVQLARSKGLPVVTVATTTQRFPIVIFSKAEENITTPADLKGKSLGLSGRFGSSYIGLLALLYANNMQETDLNIQEIGFTQVAAVSENKVQAAVGYGNNEPIQLERQGVKVNTISVADSFPLASDGLITSEKIIQENPELVRSFVRAMLRGMQDVIDDSDAAFETALTYIPEAQHGDPDLQRAVLEATIPLWQSDLTAKEGLGYTDQTSWEKTYTFLRDSKLLLDEVDISKAFTNDFIK